MNERAHLIALAGALAAALLAGPAGAQEEPKKPNILVIFGDDIGYWNVSAYNRGMMGYRTPNIDRIANEGALFTDLYAQQSCTAGRAAFITGQSTFRTGLLKVGLPGAKEGLSEQDPTLAELLKPQGYATGQFGKNHLGDRNEFLPTVHGFDEFFGNLYHLNAEDEPENVDYPKNPEFRAMFGPRGVLKCVATDTDDPTEEPRFGKWGKQKCEDTGPLTTKRMETVDEEFLGAAMNFIDRQHQAGKPFFVWFNSTRMHILKELQTLFMKEAVKYSVLPLDDRVLERLNPALVGRPDLLAGRTSLTVYQGMTGMSENVFINTKNRSHTLTAEVEIPQAGADGVIVAQAGRFGGWSLYLQNGKPTYTYNWLGLDQYTVAAPEALPAGKATIRYEFTYAGGGMGKGGTGTIFVNGKSVATGKIEQTQCCAFSADEGADVGADEGTAVSSSYAVPFA